jgi:hypothetical protein
MNISDLFNHTVNNNTLFLKISSSNIVSLLNLLDYNDAYKIYSINSSKVKSLLFNNKLDPNNFCVFYQILIGVSEKLPDFIVMANKKITKEPSDFTYIDTFNQGTIWLPVSQSNYTPFGVIYSVNKPSTINIYTLQIDYLMKKQIDMPHIYTNSDLDMKSMTHSYLGSYGLLKSKFVGNTDKFRIMNKNKYITNIGGNLVLRDAGYNEQQQFTYTNDGELELNDLCLTDKNKLVGLENCSKNNNQKWYFQNNSIKSQDNDMCLDVINDETFVVNNCSSDQDWTIANNSFDDPTEVSWKTHKGKTVMLTTSDEPWYLNHPMITENTIPIINDVVSNNENYFDNLNKVEYKYGDFESKFVIDPTKSSMGYGYSYADRMGKPCNLTNKITIEKFDGVQLSTQSSNLDTILSIIVLLAIILFLYKNKN